MWALGYERVIEIRNVLPVPPPRLYQPVQRVHPVPAVALRLQKAAASAFFEALGIKYLPGVLVELLRQYDVSFALWSFCEEFHLRFHALADPGAPDHEEHRERLEKIVGVLIDTEARVRDTLLPGQPVVDALRRSLSEAEALLDQLHRAVMVWRDLQAGTVEWPRFVQFREIAARKLVDWAALDRETLDKISVKAVEFQKLRERFARAEVEIRRLAPELLRADDPDVRLLAERMVDTAGAVIDGIQQGRLEPRDGVLEIEDILTVLRSYAQAPATPPPDAVAKLQHCFGVLGVTPRVTRNGVKKAFRTLAMQWHPDHNRSPEATERFREINECYELILRSLP